MYGIFTFTEAGRHAVNQDSFLIEAHPADPSCLICVVADGKSGAPGAEAAPQIACRETMTTALTYSPRQLRKPKNWSRILNAADAAVSDSHDAGLATLVGACFSGNNIVGGSSGDSAAYLVAIGGHFELTSDQTKNPPVGSGAAAFTAFAAPLKPPWRVLLMTDGVWDHQGRTHVVDHLYLGIGAEELIENLKTAGRPAATGKYRDDFTVVLVENRRP